MRAGRAGAGRDGDNWYEDRRAGDGEEDDGAAEADQGGARGEPMSWALVAGGSGTIGRAVVDRLAVAGYDVVVHGFRRDTEAAANLARQRGRRAVVVRGHLGGPEAARRVATNALTLVADQERAGGPEPSIDAVVVSSGSGVMRDMADLTERHWRWTLDVTALPLVGLLTALRPRAAVALSSPGASRVVAHYGALGAAKAALEATARYLAVELAPETRVNVVSAGLVDSASARRLPTYEALRADALRATPLGRLVRPEDVANAVAWLLSEDAAMVTGATLVVDGGQGLHW